jgi:hypothetical protein
MEGVVGSTTQAPPTTQIPRTTLRIVATSNNVVLLVQLMPLPYTDPGLLV